MSDNDDIEVDSDVSMTLSNAYCCYFTNWRFSSTSVLLALAVTTPFLFVGNIFGIPANFHLNVVDFC